MGLIPEYVIDIMAIYIGTGSGKNTDQARALPHYGKGETTLTLCAQAAFQEQEDQ